jgi:flagellar biosynthesis/type III secretory pathway chaperone
MNDSLEPELVELLNTLSSTQDDLFAALGRKRECLANGDLAALAEVQQQEEALIGRLQGCHEQRLKLLKRASSQGLPADSLRTLVSVAPGVDRKNLQQRVAQASQRSRLLQQQNLSNWVVAQRTLIHLSQLLEIIATNGRMRPTYEKGDVAGGQGTLVDQAA